MNLWQNILTYCSEAAPLSHVPVSAVYLCMHGAVVISSTLDPRNMVVGGYLGSKSSSPVICIWQDRCGKPGPGALVPHQGLQFTKLLSKAGVGWGQSLCDGGVPVCYAGLRGSVEVSIA